MGDNGFLTKPELLRRIRRLEQDIRDLDKSIQRRQSQLEKAEEELAAMIAVYDGWENPSGS